MGEEGDTLLCPPRPGTSLGLGDHVLADFMGSFIAMQAMEGQEHL